MKLWVVLFCIVASSVCVLSPGMSAQTRRSPAGPEGENTTAVAFQIRNVNMLLTRDIILGIRSLRGELQRTQPQVPVTFDNSDSFVVNADSAEIHIPTSSMTALMNSYVFGYKEAPIKKVTVSIENGKLIQRGTVHKGVDLPFEMEASLSVTQDGKVRVHADKIKAEHFPVKGLLHLLGADLEKLIHDNPGRGVQAENDDLILAPSSMTPPPHIHGRVVRVSLVGDSIVLYFDSGRHPSVLKPPLDTGAYIYHRGGILRFGRLTMNDADLEIVGDRAGSFNFFLHEYKKQLVAGYSKNTETNGLVSHMVDYSHFEPQLISRAQTASQH